MVTPSFFCQIVFSATLRHSSSSGTPHRILLLFFVTLLFPFPLYTSMNDRSQLESQR